MRLLLEAAARLALRVGQGRRVGSSAFLVNLLTQGSRAMRRSWRCISAIAASLLLVYDLVRPTPATGTDVIEYFGPLS